MGPTCRPRPFDQSTRQRGRATEWAVLVGLWDGQTVRPSVFWGWAAQMGLSENGEYLGKKKMKATRILENSYAELHSPCRK